MSKHTRRDMAKVVAAAAAGSVAGKACAPFRNDDQEALWNDGVDHGYTLSTLDMIRNERIQTALRLQQAIELGDRTAKELGLGLHSFDLERERECSGTVTWTATFWYRPGDNPCGWDPDPLTAVEKARAAALAWKAEQ